jgi:hypothetical protein
MVNALDQAIRNEELKAQFQLIIARRLAVELPQLKRHARARTRGGILPFQSKGLAATTACGRCQATVDASKSMRGWSGPQ